MVLYLSFCIIFFFTVHDCYCLNMERLELPGLVKLFQPLKIACRYRLGTIRLESVKWYKDDQEFFRFTPSERPQTRKFNIPGIEIDMEKSDMHVISLINVSISSAGVYRCEVSSDSPDFETVQESRRMDVYYIPDGVPTVFLNKTDILPNEDIVAQCVSGKSFPVQKLYWYLNGNQVNKKCITKEYVTTDRNGLLTEHSWIKVRARGGPGPILVSCVGFQGSFYPDRTHVEVALGKDTAADPMLQRSSANYITNNYRKLINLGCMCASIAVIHLFHH